MTATPMTSLNEMFALAQTFTFDQAGTGDPVPFFREEHPFSQFHRSPMRVDDNLLPTAEHWMMYAKALTFKDEASAAAVLAATTPLAAKRVGRGVTGFDAAVWGARAMTVVAVGSLAKYTQHPDLAAELLSTGDRPLLEASPYDRLWGIGIDAATLRAGRPWYGKNQLGRVLMTVRHHLATA